MVRAYGNVRVRVFVGYGLGVRGERVLHAVEEKNKGKKIVPRKMTSGNNS